MRISHSRVVKYPMSSFDIVRVRFVVFIVFVGLHSVDVCSAQIGERKSPEFFGDFRLRSEYDANRDGGLQDRFRERIRFRVGSKYEITDYVTAAARLVTGDPDDPNSTFQSLGTVFNRMTLSLDQIYLNLRFKQLPLWIRAGKFPHPFQTPAVYKELVWDADVHPEGAAAGYSFNWSQTRIGAVAAHYILVERNNGRDAYCVAGQLQFDASERPISIAGALGAYRYYHINDDDAVFWDNGGNVGVTRFASEFAVVDGFVNVAYKHAVWLSTVNVQFIQNVEAAVDDDAGIAFGASFSKAKDNRAIKFYYQYQVVEQDAVLSPFSQDDFLAQTNFKGHVFGVRYDVSEKIGVYLWGLVSKRKNPGGGNNQARLRADLDVSL